MRVYVWVEESQDAPRSQGYASFHVKVSVMGVDCAWLGLSGLSEGRVACDGDGLDRTALRWLT